MHRQATNYGGNRQRYRANNNAPAQRQAYQAPVAAPGYYNNMPAYQQAPYNGGYNHAYMGNNYAYTGYANAPAAQYGYNNAGYQQAAHIWTGNPAQPPAVPHPASYGQGYVGYPGSMASGWNNYAGHWNNAQPPQGSYRAPTGMATSPPPPAPGYSNQSRRRHHAPAANNQAPPNRAPPPAPAHAAQLGPMPLVPPGFRVFYYEMEEACAPNACLQQQLATTPATRFEQEVTAASRAEEHKAGGHSKPGEGGKMLVPHPEEHGPHQVPESPKIQARQSPKPRVLSIDGGPAQPIFPAGLGPKELADWESTWEWWTRDAIVMDGWRKLCWRQVSYGTHPTSGTLIGGPLELAWMDYGSTARQPAANLSVQFAEAAVRRYKELYGGAVPPVEQHLQQEYQPIYKYQYALGSPSRGPIMWLY